VTRRRTVLVVALLTLAGAVAALLRIADDHPEPIANMARLPQLLWTRVLPARPSRRARLADLTAPEREAVRALGGRLDAMILWSSNRNGNHELYLLDLRAQSLRRLTNHPNVDYFGRFSPDGRQVLFLRSQREGVSPRETTAWDVFLVNVNGAEERRIARNGYHPTWTADGKGIVFNRESQVFRYDMGTGQETLLLDGQLEFPGLSEIGDFELGPDGRRLGFGLRGRFAGRHGLEGPFSGAVVFDLSARTLVTLTRDQACQTTWAPDGRGLYWIETGGNGGTRVMTGQADGGGRRVFMDLPGRYSHEYFPKLSNDGRWLIWGAAAEGHEQDRADYEIFLWEIGTPAEQVVRLTFHEGNDQWPDIRVSQHEHDN
jgi:hypothetical protein